MANWCFTRIAVKAADNDPEALTQLEELRKLAEDTVHFRTDSISPGWLGRLLEQCGIDPDRSSCRGFIRTVSEPETADGIRFIRIEEDDAWYPNLEVWNQILDQTRFSRLAFVAAAEEPGCEVFINTDRDGTIFPERYLLKYCERKDEEEGEWILFLRTTREKLEEECRELFGICASAEEILEKGGDLEGSEQAEYRLLRLYEYEDIS